jgi:hypothetical protein
VVAETDLFAPPARHLEFPANAGGFSHIFAAFSHGDNRTDDKLLLFLHSATVFLNIVTLSSCKIYFYLKVVPARRPYTSIIL